MEIMKNPQYKLFNISTRVYFRTTEKKKTQNCKNVLRRQ